MTNEQLSVLLAERLMGWTAAPDRFMTGDRHWISRWRFQPFDDVKDALMVLKAAGATMVLTVSVDGSYTAQVKVGNRGGGALSTSAAGSIAGAIAVALGLDPPEGIAAVIEEKGGRAQ